MVALCAVAAAFAAAGGLLLAPAAWARRRKVVIAPGPLPCATLTDAVAACRACGLEGWPLVTFAQQLTYGQFRCYSCRNLWDTPARAFAHGMGYCTQYNLALKQILDALGIETRAVFSLHVRVAGNDRWTMGHTWLQVRCEGEWRAVCAGDGDNLPGAVNFTAVAPVWPGRPLFLFLTDLGMIGFCGFLEWRALLTGRPLPPWMFYVRHG
jgi:hypothetical protein